MVINPAGLVLTNNHVIAGSTKITATVVATGKTYPATVTGYDKAADVALIQLQGAAGLRTVPVGNSAPVRDGDPVVRWATPRDRAPSSRPPGRSPAPARSLPPLTRALRPLPRRCTA
jgi:S1-C subfamily serine protease